MRRVLSPLVVSLVLLVRSPLRADTYVIDKIHSDTTFSVRHLVGKFIGKFNDFSCTIVGEASKPAASSVQFTIKAASVDTGMNIRDDHLRSADFLDAGKFPEITFKSVSIKASGKKNVFDVTGDLTMRGVTKRVTLPVEYLGSARDPRGREVAGFALTTTIKRQDYGINCDDTLDNGGALLGDDVEVSINLQT